MLRIWCKTVSHVYFQQGESKGGRNWLRHKIEVLDLSLFKQNTKPCVFHILSAPERVSPPSNSPCILPDWHGVDYVSEVNMEQEEQAPAVGVLKNENVRAMM